MLTFLKTAASLTMYTSSMNRQHQVSNQQKMLQVQWFLQMQCLIASVVTQDILSRFNGSWSLQPILNEEETHVVGTRAVLDQDILPAGAAQCLLWTSLDDCTIRPKYYFGQLACSTVKAHLLAKYGVPDICLMCPCTMGCRR